MNDTELLLSGANQMLQAAEFAAGLWYNDYAQNKQNDFNLEMWKLQNEYNSPQSQMQRFSQAGLNPNLIYSQGTNGNNASAPQKNVPDQQHNIDKIGKAFNIINLMTAGAGLKKAQEEARLTELERFDKEDERDAVSRLQDLYDYDLQTGKYILHEPSDSEVTVTRKNPRGSRPGDLPISRGLMLQQLVKNAQGTYLLPYRSTLMDYQKQFIAPQVQMSNYDAKHYPWLFWTGLGSRAAGGLGSLLKLFL